MSFGIRKTSINSVVTSDIFNGSQVSSRTVDADVVSYGTLDPTIELVNEGTGISLTTSSDLGLKSISAGTGITITESLNDLSISSASGGTTISVVRIPVSQLIGGSFLYTDLGVPVDVIGTKASTITVIPNMAGGDKFFSSEDIYKVELQLFLQYPNQFGGSAKRTFTTILGNNSTLRSVAQGVPASSNNWRENATSFFYGVTAGVQINGTVNTNANTPVSYNGGDFFVLFQD